METAKRVDKNINFVGQTGLTGTGSAIGLKSTLLILSKLDFTQNSFDLTSNFCEYDNPKKLFLKYDPMHLSPEGHEFVYSLTKKYILK